MNTLAQHVNQHPEIKPQEWADRFGVSRPHFYMLIGGQRQPSPEVAKAIERATGGEVPATDWPSIRKLLDAAKGIGA
jgi:DNA-binding transcriptional regulator YdaS (Cro superfamily)